MLSKPSSSHTPYNYGFNDPVFYNDPAGDYPLEVKMDMESHGGGGAVYNYGQEGFSSPYFGNGGGGKGVYRSQSAGPDILGDAQAVGNGQMSLEDYAAKFGTNYGGGFGGLHSAMASLDAITQDASLFRFSVLGKMYGGVYHTENGIVVSAAIAQVAEDYSGAWVPTSELNIFEFTEQLNNANVSGPGSDFIYDNNNSIGLGLETLENGTTGAIEEVLKNKALYTAGTKIGAKVVGGSVIGLNLGVTFYTIGKELQSNDPKAFNTHSFVNMGVTVLTTGATAIGIIFAGATAPVWVPAVAIGGAAVGIGYGIAQVAGIDQWIDSRYGFK